MAKQPLKFVCLNPHKVTKTTPSSPLSPTDIVSHANVHALVASLSPEKSCSAFFDGELTDGKPVIQVVGFDKNQRQQLHSYCTKGIPTTLKNCQIQLITN